MRTSKKPPPKKRKAKAVKKTKPIKPTTRFRTIDTANPDEVAQFAEDFDLTPVPRLDKDLEEAARRMGPAQVRFLVDAYYVQQKNRIRTSHQTRKLEEYEKPSLAIEWLSTQNDTLENRVKRMLDVYSAANDLGKWMRSITGVGPVVSSGLLAGLDINPKDKKGNPLGPRSTVGKFWRICGLDPTTRKKKGEKLIWDPSLKRLCFLLGESFTKVSNHPDDIYGKVYLARKAREIGKNDAGDFADQAKKSLEERDFSKDTMARAWYSGCYAAGFCARYNAAPADVRPELLKTEKGEPSSGVQMLPPARIQLRSQRYAVKLFLSHMHWVWHEMEFGTPPPKPYILTADPKHTHFIAPPNWPPSRQKAA